jgi:fibronectin type 3 domain-containing protein
LGDTGSAQVQVKASDDPACECVDDLSARPKYTKVQLTWTPIAGAASYNVYRGTINGGPYALLANTPSTYSTYLDTSVVAGTTYYYVVRPAGLNGNELCQSNEASATPVGRVKVCVSDLTARPKGTKVQLSWTHTSAASYNVYRGTVAGGPYLKIGNTTSTYSTYLDETVAAGTTYYYVVREVAPNGSELCQSNEASAKPVAR